LAFSTVDINKVSEQNATRALKLEVATNQVDTGGDLAAVMRLALTEERKNREQLIGEISRAQQTAGKQQSLLAEREKQIQTVQEQLQSREQQAQKLQEQFSAAQANIQTLNQQLQNSSAETVLSKEKLAAMQAEMRKQVEQSTGLQQQLAQLA